MDESVTLVAARTLLAWLTAESQGRRTSGVPVFAIAGAQGAGKTTVLRELPKLLTDAGGYRVATLSLDDFYLPRAERLVLAREVHPLFATRGVPGTHDVALLEKVLDDLGAGRGASIPRFDKAADDRVALAGAERQGWARIEAGTLELIVLEGWCLALPPEPDAALSVPVNELERLEDAGGVWRTEVNRALATSYARLFARFDRVVALLAPSFDAVFEWRREQERALAATLAATDERRQGLLTEPEPLRRFLAHFERLTRHALRCLPDLADLSIYLDAARGVLRVVESTQTAKRGKPWPAS